MTLADGTSFLGSKALGNKLFNCDCYGPLDRLLDQLFAGTSSEGDVEAVAIIGNPGQQDSFFPPSPLDLITCLHIEDHRLAC
jgi:hypothetical protein